MSEGGIKKARLEAADKKLNDELAIWQELNLNPHGWRMGNNELLFRCELLVLTKIIQEKLDVSQEDMDIALKEVLLEQLENLRPQVMEQQAELARAAILAGQPVRPDIRI